MRETPWVTWLLSIRNAMPYLPETLESVARQTYPHHKLLVWDDCSEDGSLQELERWIPRRIPGRIFAGKSMRLGPSLAFLVNQADTELCARIDGDDVNEPVRLERQVLYMTAHRQVGVLGTQIQLIDEAGAPFQDAMWTYPTSDAESRWLSRWQTRVCHPTVMFRRSVVLDAGNYRETRYEDSDLWLRVARLAEIQNLGERLLRYRRTSTSQTGQTSDFLEANRETARLNATELFPNITDASRAMELWESTHPCQMDGAATLRDARDLKDAATELARRAGKPDSYFTGTQTYKDQRYHLRRRLLEQAGLGPLMHLRRRWTAARIFSK